MKKFRIVKENDLYVPYKKRLFRYKKLCVTGFNTIYLAIKFLSDNYGTPTVFSESDQLEILN